MQSNPFFRELLTQVAGPTLGSQGAPITPKAPCPAPQSASERVAALEPFVADTPKTPFPASSSERCAADVMQDATPSTAQKSAICPSEAVVPPSPISVDASEEEEQNPTQKKPAAKVPAAKATTNNANKAKGKEGEDEGEGDDDDEDGEEEGEEEAEYSEE